MKNKVKYLFKVKQLPNGDIRCFPIRKDVSKSASSGTKNVVATMPSRVIELKKVKDLESNISASCGVRPDIKGRTITVAGVEESALDSVGDVFDMFGCQWDVED